MKNNKNISIKILIFFFILITTYFYKNKKNIYLYKKKNIIKKGEYLTRTANCISCHTINGGKPYSGGNIINTYFGKIYTPNITFHKNGIKKINLKDFLKIIKLGIDKNNNFLYPALPYINYKNIKSKEISYIYFFLKSIPLSSSNNKSNIIKFPFKYKKLLLIWRMFFFKNFNFKNFYKNKNIIKRGKYIVDTLGHCNMCHSQSNIFAANISKLNFTGNFINQKNWYIKPIINNTLKGLKKKSINNIINLLKFGKYKKSLISGSMTEVINNSLQYVDKVDIKSISKYIKSSFNKNTFFKKKNLIRFNKHFSKNFFKKGKLIYKKNCAKCHGTGLGDINYPILINKLFNYYSLWNFIKKIKNSININTYKNFNKVLMPNFINIYNNKKYYYLINYFFFIKKLK